jgi:hypothetical protein
MNDENIFSNDFDRYTSMKLLHWFRSDAKVEKSQFLQCLEREWQLETNGRFDEIASTRYSTPFARISVLSARSSSVRVCEDEEEVEYRLIVPTGCAGESSYLIDLQGIGKVTSTFITDLNAPYLQFGECLRTVLRLAEKSRWSLTRLTFSASLIYWIPSSSIRLNSTSSDTSVCKQSNC